MARARAYLAWLALLGLALTTLSLPAAAQTGPSPGPADLVLLYDSARPRNSDTNLCRLAEYFGLVCRRIAVDREGLSLQALRDDTGGYARLIAVNADRLRGDGAVRPEQLDLINVALAQGSSLMVGAGSDAQALPGLAALTAGTIAGIDNPRDSIKDYFVSTARPDLTREFTGQRITYDEPRAQRDLTVRLSDGLGVTPIITSTDDSGSSYAILTEWRLNAGRVFVETGEPADSLDEKGFTRTYYDKDNFAKLTPSLMVLRYVFGDAAWHSDVDYANLTIDDPSLTEPFFNLSYAELVRQMRVHQFHTTIATIPGEAKSAQPAVIELFTAHPDLLSLVMHGNNHDDYEFYKYAVQPGEVFEGSMKLPARPLADQVADIKQGIERLNALTDRTGVPWDRIMIFPYGIGPRETMAALKSLNFLATVNAQEIPLEAVRPSRWDFGMYPAAMDFESFAVIQRRHRFARGEKIDPEMIPFDLFLDRPALFYSHQADLFPKRVYDTGWNAIADGVNDLPGEVRWAGLGEIVRHLHRERVTRDGTVAVEMYGSRLDLDNRTDAERVYHVSRVETGNVPIVRATVNGVPVLYDLSGGRLRLTLTLPPHQGAQIEIVYAEAPLPVLAEAQ